MAISGTVDVATPTHSSFVRTMVWEVANRAGRSGLQLLTFVVFSRALPISQVGILATWLAITQTLIAFIDSGPIIAAQQLQSTPFPLRVAAVVRQGFRGALLGIAIATLALVTLAAFGQTEMAFGAAVSGVMAIVAGLSCGPTAYLMHYLRFRALALAELSSSFICTGIGAGIILFSDAPDARYAMVVVASAGLLRAIVLNSMVRPDVLRVDARLRRVVDREMGRSSVAASAYVGLLTLARNVDYMIIGALSSSTTVASYSRAYQLADFPTQLVGMAAERVGLVAFQGSDDPDEDVGILRATFAISLGTALIVSPVVVLARLAIALTAGPAYAQVASSLAVLAACSPARSVTRLLLGASMAQRSRGAIEVTVVQIMILTVAVSATARMSPLAVSLAVASSNLLHFLYVVVVMGRPLELSRMKIVNASWPCIVPVALAGICLTLRIY